MATRRFLPYVVGFGAGVGAALFTLDSLDTSFFNNATARSLSPPPLPLSSLVTMTGSNASEIVTRAFTSYANFIAGQMQPVLAVVAPNTKEKKERLINIAIRKNGLLAAKLCEAFLKEEATSSVKVVPDNTAASNDSSVYADFGNVVLHVARDWGSSKSNHNKAILDATAKYVMTPTADGIQPQLRILVPGSGCGGLLSDLITLANAHRSSPSHDSVHITATETSKAFLAFLRAIIVPNNKNNNENIFFQGDLLPYAHVLQDAFYGDERDQFLHVPVTVQQTCFVATKQALLAANTTRS